MHRTYGSFVDSDLLVYSYFCGSVLEILDTVAAVVQGVNKLKICFLGWEGRFVF